MNHPLETASLHEGIAVEVGRSCQARVEKLMGMTLLAGVLASTLVVLLGGVAYVWRHGGSIIDYRVFHGEPSDFTSLKGIRKDVQAFSGRGIIQLGLILLVGLQVVRVAMTGVFFLAGRDRMFVAITTIVLALLAYGLVFESAGVR
jgi:uncharacterized membrane protein